MNPPHELRAEPQPVIVADYIPERSASPRRENTRKIRSRSDRGLENRSSRDESLIRDVLSSRLDFIKKKK